MQVWSHVFNGAGVVLILAPFVVPFLREMPELPATGWIVTVAAILLIFGSLDRIAVFAIDSIGLRAETRQVVQEARLSIKNTREATKHLGSLMMFLLAATNGGGNQYDQQRETLLRQLSDLGLSEEDIEKVVEGEKKVFSPMYIYYIHRQALSDGELKPKFVWSSDPVRLFDMDFDQLPSANELREFYRDNGVLTVDLDGKLSDYEHYLKTGTQRRPWVWKDRHGWSEPR